LPASQIVGTAVRRIDGQPKVTGQIRFGADLPIPGLLYCRLVPSPYAHARIVKIDASAALALPGVYAVIGGEELDLPGLNPASRPKMPLARGEVFFRGQPVAAVLAESDALAEDAAALVNVEYEPLPVIPNAAAALAPDAPVVRPLPKSAEDGEAAAHATVSVAEEPKEQQGPNVSDTVHLKRGNVEQGFAEADVIVERTYRTAMVHQSYLEPRVVTAAPDPLSGGVTVWTATQGVFYCRTEIAQALGLPEHEVKVVPTTVGGGFGAKICVMEPLVAALARQVQRPVRLVYTRSDEFLNPTPAPPATISVKLGAKRDGTFTALQARVLFDAGSFPGAPMAISSLLLGSCYKVPNLDIQGQEVLSHKPGPGAYRAPGSVQASFAIESTVEQVARQLGMDPVELRLKNCVDQGDPQASGDRWGVIGLRACLEALRDHPAYRAAKQPGEGRGVAVGAWPGGLEPANAICRLDRDGKLTVQVGAVDISGTSTTLAMIAAETFGLPLEDVKMVHADSDTAPNSGMAGGSKITYTVGEAVRRAAEEARLQLLRIAADKLEVSPDDLVLADGRVHVRGAPDRGLAVKELARLSLEFGSKYEPVYGRGATATAERAPGFAVHLAKVRVDPDTGHVQVTDYVAVQDVGKAINPPEVEGQIRGGVTQGLGWALFEQMRYDEQGQLLTGTFADYALPLAIDVPNITPVIVEVPAPRGPFGARGVGEPPVVPPAAAVANAVEDAIGARITDLPITSEKVLRALGRL